MTYDSLFLQLFLFLIFQILPKKDRKKKYHILKITFTCNFYITFINIKYFYIKSASA